MTDFAEVIFVVLLVGALTGMYIYWLMLRRLCENHREVWEELGSPSFPFNSSISSNIKVKKFLKSDECRNLQDDILDRMVSLERKLGIVYVGVLALILARIGYEACLR